MSANPNVNVKISITGKDGASKELDRVGRSAAKLGDDLRGAAGAGDGLTSSLRSIAGGDITGGIEGLSAALGVGGLGLAALSAAAAVATATAAIAAAVVKTAEWSEQIEIMRARMATAFVGGSHEALAVANAVGVSVDAIVELQTSLRASGADGEITVAQLQRMADAAAAMGQQGEAPLLAFAAALRTGATDGLAQVGVMVRGKQAIAEYADELGKSAATLTTAERAQAVLGATLAAVERTQTATSATLQRQGAALDTLGNKWSEIKLVMSDLVAGPAAAMVESLLAIIDGAQRASTVLIALGRLAVAPLVSMFRVLSKSIEANAAVMRGDFADGARLAGEALASAALPVVDSIRDISRLSEAAESYGEQARRAADYTRASGVAASVSSGQVGGLAVAYDMFGDAAVKAAAAQAKFAAQDAADRKRRADAASAAAAQRRAAAKALRERQGAEFMAGANAPDTAGAAIAAAEAQSAQALATTYEALEDRILSAYQTIATDPARKAALDQQRIQIDLAREEAKIRGDLFIEEADQIRAIAALREEANTKIAASQAAARDATLSQVQAWAGAGQAVAGALLEGDAAARASAGLQAIIAGADAFKYFAAGNIPGGIASTAAAIGYAKAALMPAPPTPGGGGTQPAKPAAPDRSGGPSNTTINISGIMTTKAEVGAAMKKAMKAAQPTGMAPA